jgi:hypothetical protein
MLDTVLQIGKILRASPDGLKHHRYIKKAPIYDEKLNPVKFWTIPVQLDGTFNFEEIKPLNDENLQQKLFYLNYKQSDADSSKPYIYGDLYRTITKTGEDGNFRLGDPEKRSWVALNSFQRAESLEPIATERVRQFRSSFRKQINAMEQFLRDNKNVYIHFDIAGHRWTELEEIDHLNQSIVQTFFDKTVHGYVMGVFLFKTLATGSSRTPGFDPSREYRNRVFRNESEALDLLYGINYASRSAVRKNDFKVIVLPRGEGLDAKQIERFFERRGSSEPDTEVEDAETSLQTNAEANVVDAATEDDEFFLFANEDAANADTPILQYDCIFSKAGGTKPDIDMVEIAGICRSKISEISGTVRKVREEIQSERTAFYLHLYAKPLKKEPPRLTIASAFLKIINDPSKKKSKYQSHLFRVMPEIFNGSYYQDPILLPALIEKTEMSIRNDEMFFFNDAKFAFKFLYHIQVSGEERFMQIQQSASYQIGLLLGTMARPLRSKINSFDKNYAGLLSRRITTLIDVMTFANDVNQKLIMHEALYRDVRQASQNLAAIMSEFTGRYDKNECAFGFFENYFASWKPAEEPTETSASEVATNVDPQMV